MTLYRRVPRDYRGNESPFDYVPVSIPELADLLRKEGMLVREWRCWREDGSYYGPCSEEKIADWKTTTGEGWAGRHYDCGWQLYVMESDALAVSQPTGETG